MVKLFKILFVVSMMLLPVSSGFAVQNSGDVVLEGYVQKVPDTFFGTWRVVSVCEDSDSPVIFKNKGIDLWNLSQENGVITLTNPFSGAEAILNIEEAKGNSINFTKVGKYDGKVVTDKVIITINGDNFEGYDFLKLETLSNIDGKVMKTESAKYSIKGEKLAGQSIGR